MHTSQQLSHSDTSSTQDEVATRAETPNSEKDISFLKKTKQFKTFLKYHAEQNYSILSQVKDRTFSSDKILKLISSFCKIINNFKLLTNLKSNERLINQIRQLRRLIKYDRILMIIKEQVTNLKKQKLSKIDKAMMIFKLMILFGDSNDILAYLIQKKVFINDSLLVKLRRNVGDIFFLQCLGWLIYYSSEYSRSKTQQNRQKNKMMIIRYGLDGLVSHNDFTHRLFTIDAKVMSVIAVFSSWFNLKLAWK